jgi:hypothetical protein
LSIVAGRLNGAWVEGRQGFFNLFVSVSDPGDPQPD